MYGKEKLFAKKFVNAFYVSCTKHNKTRRSILQLLRTKDRMDLRDNVYMAVLTRDAPQVCGVLLHHKVVSTLSELREWMRRPDQHASHMALLAEVQSMLPYEKVAEMEPNDFKLWLLHCKQLVIEDEQLGETERDDLLREIHTCFNAITSP